MIEEEFQKVQEDLLSVENSKPVVPMIKLEKLRNSLDATNEKLMKNYESTFMNVFINKTHKFIKKKEESKQNHKSKTYDLFHTFVGDADQYGSLVEEGSIFEEYKAKAYTEIPNLESPNDLLLKSELYTIFEYEELKQKYPYDLAKRFEE
jgi:hypothetical protein